jgi:exosortase
MEFAVQDLASRQQVETVGGDASSKMQFALLVVLLTLLYGRIFWHLGVQWARDPNFSHGFFVPVFSAYLLWDNRRSLALLPIQPSWTGAPLLLLGLASLIVGVLGAELFLSRVSFVPVIGGLTVMLLGWKWLRQTAFPWLFLLLMVPLPALLFNQITFPLQIFASRLAATVLPWLGVPVLREGNVIHLPAMALEVAEACSGIRSLMSLITLSLMYGYVLERRWQLRALLAIAAFPIAVAANSFRIVGTGLLVQYWDPDKAEGFFHTFSGWMVFVVAILLLFAVRTLLHRFWPPDPSRESTNEAH